MVAENGVEGIEIAKENKPDPVICDIMMPEIDGFGVQNFKHGSELWERSLYLSHRQVKSRYIRKGMNSGADDYLIKPVSKNDLLIR